jgi:carbonic anhydrase
MRRIFVLLLLCSSLFAQQAPQAQAPQPQAPAPQAHQITPDELWRVLLLGNEQYVAGKLVYDNLKEERKMFAKGQLPPFTILSCSDSRVPPELVFNQSLGTLFVVRAAGSVADTFALASIEYAVEKGYTHLIVVLGHENCGAVKDSLGPTDPASPNVLALAQRIRASFVGIPYNNADEANVRKAVEANTRASATYLVAQSPIIRKAALDGRLKIVTAYYEMESGKVVTLN